MSREINGQAHEPSPRYLQGYPTKALLGPAYTRGENNSRSRIISVDLYWDE